MRLDGAVVRPQSSDTSYWKHCVVTVQRTVMPKVELSQWTLCACILRLAVVDADFADGPGLLRFRIMEELPAGSEVGTIRPRNVDEAQLNQVEFTLRESSPHRRYFDVDRRNGQLYTSVVIDREALCPHHPATCTLTLETVVGPRRFFDIIRVVVDVMDVNDHAPTFPRRSTAVTLTECVGPATVRLPAADDADAGPPPTYHVESSPVPATLEVVLLFDGSHDLRLQLDGAAVARRRSVTLLIVASDNGDPPLTDTLQVHLMPACVDEVTSIITTADTTSRVHDDSGLKFDSATYHVTISESTPVGATVLRVRAVSRHHLGDVITYSLSNRSTIAPMFAINPDTGELSLRGYLVPQRSTVTRLIVAASHAASLPVYADVIVHVGVDDSTAVIVIRDACDGCRHEASVNEDAPPETLVATVFVSSRSDVTCSSMTSSPFELHVSVDDATTYRLLTTSSLDREVQSAHQLSVDCCPSTSGSKATSTRSFIDVTVGDVNDNRPEVVSETPVEVIICSIFITTFNSSINKHSLLKYRIHRKLILTTDLDWLKYVSSLFRYCHLPRI